ncbi:molecular chaperone DjiA [Roseobacter sp. HKCCA0434]|uniref:molecular chaperone DjiA n=1 Tax=Roseobacter sp. HKCCA0434 TaxID=3079297 RepID=UPI00290587B3|nr:molecular chaperone DjiA [Roseobacter sp. HKCCA0434]
MSIWTRITDAVSALRQGEGLSAVFDRLSAPPERSVAFTIAVIALGAKMAKADGQVTRDEVTAFREVFAISPRDEAKAARVFNLARQDAAGFESYAAQIARMFGGDRSVLEDLMEGLFHIAVADGVYHPDEDTFLARVAEMFGLGERCFRVLRARHVPDAAPDPYDVLGVSPEMTLDEMRARWRALVRETHPDRMIARGVPEEAVKLATRRLAAINRAWEEVLEARSAA